jgi:predicted nuclease of predicted toxin-antitoxin system
VNLVGDERVDRPVVERLRQEGHQVLSVAESSPGVADDEVLAHANAADAVLLTADKDFGELVFRHRLAHSGVVPLRLAGLPNAIKAEVVAEVCRTRAAELVGAFSVVSGRPRAPIVAPRRPRNGQPMMRKPTRREREIYVESIAN